MRRTLGAGESSSILLLGVCASSVLALFLSLIRSLSATYFDGMSLYSWIGYPLMQVGFVAVVLVYSKARRLDLRYIARVNAPKNPKQVLLLPVISVAAIMTFLPFANLWSSFLGIIGYHGASASMPAFGNVGSYFLALFLLGLLPALGEELLLRGMTLSGLSTRGAAFGIFMSALFFSLMHGNPLQTVHQFGLGVVLAITLYLTGSIWAAVVVHFFNNFISVTLTAYLPQVDALIMKLGYFNWLTGAASVVIGLFLLILCFFVLYKMRGKGLRVVSGGIDYDEFSIRLTEDSYIQKPNPAKEFFAFFGSLFTLKGLRRTFGELFNVSGVEYIGKSQPMWGVYLSLGLLVVYWLYAFIVNMI